MMQACLWPRSPSASAFRPAPAGDGSNGSRRTGLSSAGSPSSTGKTGPGFRGLLHCQTVPADQGKPGHFRTGGQILAPSHPVRHGHRLGRLRTADHHQRYPRLRRLPARQTVVPGPGFQHRKQDRRPLGEEHDGCAVGTGYALCAAEGVSHPQRRHPGRVIG